MSMSPEDSRIFQLGIEIENVRAEKRAVEEKLAKLQSQFNIVKLTYRNFWASVSESHRVCRCSVNAKLRKILEDERKLLP